MTTGIQGVAGCPWGCPNDSYDACDRNGSRSQCNATCCPAHLGPDEIIAPSGRLRSQWEMDGGARNIRALGGDPNFNSVELPTANAVPVGHSPGPWRVADHGSGLGVRDALGRRVASLRYKGSSVSAGVPVGENIGNARLIAAAPDLLRALELVTARLELWTVGVETSESAWEDLAAIAQASGAIERAHGREE